MGESPKLRTRLLARTRLKIRRPEWLNPACSSLSDGRRQIKKQQQQYLMRGMMSESLSNPAYLTSIQLKTYYLLSHFVV